MPSIYLQVIRWGVVITHVKRTNLSNVSVILKMLFGVLENRSQPQPWIFFLLGMEPEMSDSRGGLSILRAALSHFKVFSSRTGLLLGPVWHFSALSLWGWNINKVSLKVYQLLKLSRSLPITVTKQCVQRKNMFSLPNGQQTWHKVKAELMRAAGDGSIFGSTW